MQLWFDDEKSLQAANQFQQIRVEYLIKIWRNDLALKAKGFSIQDGDIEKALTHFNERTLTATKRSELLLTGALLTKDWPQSY